MRAAPYSKQYAHKSSRNPSPIVVVRVYMVFMAIIAGFFFVAFMTKYLKHAARLGDDGRIHPGTPRPSAAVHTKLVFVTAWIDLGPEHTEKTPVARLKHFKR